MAHACRITLLGGFRAEVDGRPVPDDRWKHRRGADLVKLLALAPGHRLHREQVIDAMWPELQPEAGAANLRKAMHYARRALGGEGAVRADGAMLQLWPLGSLSVDAEEFEREAAEAIRNSDPKAAARAAGLYRGELLPADQYESWAQAPRDRLRRHHLQLLRTAGLWERAVELDPLDEQAHRELMRLHLQAGNRQAAMRQFEQLRRALHEELGVGPDPETVALYQEVLAQEGQEPPTPAERARTLLAWGLVHWNRMDLEEAERTAEEARALAVDAGLGRELGEASALLGMVAHARGRWRELFRREFIDTVRRSPQLASFVFDAHLCLAEFSLYGPEGHEQAAGFAESLRAVAEEAGSAQGKALAMLMLGEADLLSGRFPLAEERLTRAAELHREARALSGETISVERLAEAATARGRRWKAERLLARAIKMAERTALASHLLVRVYGAMVEAARDAPEAMLIVDRAEAALSGGEVCQPCSMGYRIAATVASARGGDFSRARRFLEEAERIAGMWQGGPWLAAVMEARGALRLAEGEPSQAAALFREAEDLFAGVGRPFDAARCRDRFAAVAAV